MSKYQTRSKLNTSIQYKWDAMTAWKQAKVIKTLLQHSVVSDIDQSNLGIALNPVLMVVNFWKNASIDEIEGFLESLFRDSNLYIGDGEKDQKVDLVDAFPTFGGIMEVSRFILAEALGLMFHNEDLKKSILEMEL